MGELSRLEQHNRVLAKFLHPSAFSHVEEREECTVLEYTPYSVRAPVDLRYPTRLSRMRRSVHTVVGIIVPFAANPEDQATALQHTLTAVSANLRELTREGVDWTTVAVVVVLDGLNCMSDPLETYLRSALRLFDGTMLSSTMKEGEAVHLHVFERTVELPKHAQAREYYDPLQMVLAVPTAQNGDMKSYMWLLNAFCQQLEPTYVVTFVSGVKPEPKCLQSLLCRLDDDDSIAMVIPNVSTTSNTLFSPLAMSQLFLTTFHNSMSSPFHSLFGYVPTVTPSCAVTGPGHCIALRWKSIPPNVLGKFFRSQELPIADLGPMKANR